MSFVYARLFVSVVALVVAKCFVPTIPKYPSTPEGEDAAQLEPALPPLHPLRPRGVLGSKGVGMGDLPPDGERCIGSLTN